MSERERRWTRGAAVALADPEVVREREPHGRGPTTHRARRGAASGYVAHRAGGEKPCPACRGVRNRGDTAQRTQAA
jgi:hypothetical protein